MRIIFAALTAAVIGGLTANADLATRRLAGPEVSACEAGAVRIKFDLSVLPAGAAIHRADLVVRRSAPVSGADEDALLPTEVLAGFAAPEPGAAAGPLALRGPWFDRLDATDAVRRWHRGAGNGGFLVRQGARLDAAGSYVDVWYDGPAADRPPAVKGVSAVHRAGLTFITWRELEDPFAGREPTLGELRAALSRMEAARRTRYRIYRHDRPIDRRSIADAELLAEVAPLSAYNIGGVTTDHVIHRRQLRAMEDDAYARSIAKDPFSVAPDTEELADLPVRTLAIEDGRPLPPGTGLYVHQPVTPGRAYYAVMACIDGAANMVEFDGAAAGPVVEETGCGEPVLQNEANLKVFYDYPGRRLHYVQWCSPAAVGGTRLPTANLPNRHYNWSVYVPPAAEASDKPAALGIYFHDWRGLYLRPRWPHLPDQILIATGDDPPSFGYGYHESLGTLRSFREGTVRDYTAARIDEFVAWARKRWRIDGDRISCHGMGTLGGTAAMNYGMRRASEVCLIIAGYFEPRPGDCPPTAEMYGRTFRTHLAQMEAVWGRRQWNLRTAAGAGIWDDRDLIALVEGDPKRVLPFLSIGAGTTSVTWPRQARFMKALLAARQPFIAEFDWGGSPPRYGPVYVTRRGVMPAVRPDRLPFADRDYWAAERIVYSPGGSINTALAWNPQAVIDTPLRLDIEGTFNGAVTLRNAQHFRPAPGTRVQWSIDTGQRDRPSGEAVVDEHGLVTINGVGRGRLTVTVPE